MNGVMAYWSSGLLLAALIGVTAPPMPPLSKTAVEPATQLAPVDWKVATNLFAEVGHEYVLVMPTREHRFFRVTWDGKGASKAISSDGQTFEQDLAQIGIEMIPATVVRVKTNMHISIEYADRLGGVL